MHCALVPQRTCTRVTREHWEWKQVFLRIMWAFWGCYILFTLEHLFSLTFIYFKTLKYEYFSIFFNKKSRTFKDQNRFQVLLGLEIGLLKFTGFQGFSRRVQTLLSTKTFFVSITNCTFNIFCQALIGVFLSSVRVQTDKIWKPRLARTNELLVCIYLFPAFDQFQVLLL